jgi:Tfp pilus assembly protein PilO
MKLPNWNEITDIVNARNGQERLLITITVLLTLYMGTNYFLQPRLTAKQVAAANEFSLYQTLIENRSQAIHASVLEHGKDSDAGTLRKIDDLRQQLSSYSNKLTDISNSFVDANEMTALIKSILNEHKLQLVQLENSPPEAVTTNSNDMVDIYKHGIYLEISGSYHNHIRFLEKLKQSPWNIFWKELNLQAIKPGEAVLSLAIYTLNYSPVWLEI